MQIDYAVLTEPKTLQLAEKAVGATCSNWVGVEGMFRYDVTIYSSFLGLILYAGLIGTVHPAIILLLLVLSVLQFLSYRRAASYEVRRRDDLSEIEVSQRYFQKQSYNTSAGKDIRLYQLNGWLDGVYRQLNKRYQKILFRIRSAYFANDLLTLTLQLLRDGICYGFLIYRLSHGTMTVSGFVLALGAVSGFLHILTRSPPRSPNPCSVSSRSAGCGNSSISRSLQATRCRSGRNLRKKNRWKSAFPTSRFPIRAAIKGSSMMSVLHSMRASIRHLSASRRRKIHHCQADLRAISANGREYHHQRHSPWQSESGTVLQSNRGGLSGPVCTLVFDCRKCELLPTGRDRS